MKKKLWALLKVVAAAGALGIVFILAALLIEHNTALELPKPTGSFAVGRVICDWTDNASVDILAPAPGTKRELLVWIWFPASPPAEQSDATVDGYLPNELRESADRLRPPPIFRFLTRDASKVHGHSLRNAGLSPQQESYPVVILRAGAAAPVMNYSTLAEDLASHGYVVVGFDAPYRTSVVAFPDGRVITRRPENNPELVSGEEMERVGSKLLTAWTGDTAFVLERLAHLNTSDSSGTFTGRLDMTRVGVFGHSFGGATAAQFCAQDSRCKAGIDIDGSLHGSVIQTGIHRPFMFLLSDHGDFSSDAEVSQVKADIQSVYDRLPRDGRLLWAIRGANHFTFSDDGALLKSRLLRGVLRVIGMLGIDGRRQLEVTAYCVQSFFDAHLKGEGASRPAISPEVYPEIQVLY